MQFYTIVWEELFMKECYFGGYMDKGVVGILVGVQWIIVSVNRNT